METEVLRSVDGEAVLRAIANSLGHLIASGQIRERMKAVVASLGPALEVDRAYIFETHVSGGRLLCSQRAEWAREGVSAEIDNPSMQNMAFDGELSLMFPDLSSGRPFQALVHSLEDPLRSMLEQQSIRSFALVPFFSHGEFSGFIGMDDCCSERTWSDWELDALRAIAMGLGEAVTRERSEHAAALRAEELVRSRRVALGLMEDAQRAVHSAEEASRAKSAFLAMMSHEIRTPLNGIIGFTELLSAEALTAGQLDMVHTIRDCSTALLSLISDILDLSRVESGRMDFEPTRCDLPDLVAGVLQLFTPATREKDLELTWSIDPALPDTVIADGRRLRQILLNLVGNAVKFTERGRVEIRLSAQRLEDGALVLLGQVRDTGIGMSAGEQAVIFEAFSQAGPGIHRKFGGTGLGLTISRMLAQAMGGDITVESSRGAGSVFTLEIPVQTVTEPDGAPPVTEVQQSCDGLRVLVVDDIAVNVRLTESILRKFGCVTESARNGNEAVERACKGGFDVILMDVLMPGCDGIEATRQIRQIERNDPSRPRIRIIALTADAFDENRVRCLDAGMDDFLTKPLSPAAIRRALVSAGESVR